MIKFSKYTSSCFPPKGHFAIEQIRPVTAEEVNKLNDDEIAELEMLKNEKRKREFLTSRLLIKQLNREMGLDPLQFRVDKNNLGQPFGYYQNLQYDISIAHTDDFVLCGIALNFELGVDLEPLNRGVPDKLLSRILHQDELPGLEEVPPIQLWTMKEALIKLQGMGLRMNMKDLQVKPDSGEQYYVDFNNDKTAKICSFQSNNHWISIAYYSN